MFSVIEGFEGASLLVDGNEFPSYSVIEGSDGIRMFVVPDENINVRYWNLAHHYSPAFIISAESGRYLWVDDVFYEERSVVDGAYVAPDWMWVGLDRGLLDATDLMTGRPPARPTRFVHLHTHSEYSALDGLSKVSEIVDQITADEQYAVAVTDHGNCAAHPALQREADKRGVKAIFGMEAYFQPDRFARGQEHRGAYWHLTLWATDQVGLRNLWAMSTEAYADGFYDGKARLDWDTLERLNEGVLASTACLRGPVTAPWLGNEAKEVPSDPEAAEANLGRLRRIFGDRLYVELHTNALEVQKKANRYLVEQARTHGLPMIAVVDSHYPCADDAHTHEVWLAVQTGSDIADESGMFSGEHTDYHLLTEAEVRSALAYLGEDVVEASISETARLAERCTARVEGKASRPVYSRASHHDDPVQADVDKLVAICRERWEARTHRSKPQAEYEERFAYELELLVDKQFCGYFLMVWDLVSHAKRNRVLVGPGRGSGGGSLIAYLLDITEIDPVRHELLFARFMTRGREELPDFDLDFPQSKKQFMTDYVRERWGADHVAIVGTHLRLKNKSVVKDLVRTLKSELPPEAYGDIERFNKAVDECEADTAGLGLSWEDLWAQHDELLAPWLEKYPELFDLAGRMVGRLKSYAKHAAGLIIDPDNSLHGALPLRMADDGQMVTQFDFPALEALGFVKFDLLNLRTLDTIQETIDMVYAQTGHWVDIYAWDEEYHDPLIFEEICQGNTLGHFQTETTSGKVMVRRFKPTTVSELADVITLVRPGPKNSGLTDTAIRRRNGDEPIEVPDPRLEPVLAKSWGCMIYQEDIMQTTMVLAGYDDEGADKVRKILGKKKVEQAKIEGEKFIHAAIAQGGDPQVMKLLWDLMEQFAKYSFNRAHAFAYALLCFWTAWLKLHYPVQFLCATLSTVAMDRIPEFVDEARRMGYKVLPPDINISNEGFVASGNTVRYGLTSIKGVGDAACAPIIENQPFTSWDDFMERKTSKCGMGAVKALVHIGAFDTLVPNRRGLEALIAETERKESERCVFRDDHQGQRLPLIVSKQNPTPGDYFLPCSFDWAHEPAELGRTGKPLAKQKPPPKKCTKACRQFTPEPLPDPMSYPTYTRADVRNIEMELLGVWLTSTPFERIPAEDKTELATAIEIEAGGSGTYMAVALINDGVRMDRKGRGFGFVTLMTEQGKIDAIVFEKNLKKFKAPLTKGGMFLVGVNKNDRGQSLNQLIELD